MTTPDAAPGDAVANSSPGARPADGEPGRPGEHGDILERALAASFPLLLGGVLVRLVASGAYTGYVKPGMRPWLALAGAGLLLMGAWLLATPRRRPSHVPGVAWLLLAPVLAILIVAPGALGSGALERARSAPRGAANAWGPLPGTVGPQELSIGEFVDRSQSGTTVRAVPVRFTGFVATSPDASGAFRIARYRISCCAADAQAVAVVVVPDGAPPKPADDRWVRVEGELVPDDPAVLEPRFHVTSMELVAEPAQPYESMLSR